MKRTKKIYVAKAVLLAVSTLVLTGCGKTADISPRTEIAEEQQDVPQVQAPTNDGKEQDEAEGDTGENQDMDTVKAQRGEQEQDEDTDIVIQKTQEDWDEINLKERAEFEERVKAAGGITEEEAIEIAKKTMEEDIGEKAKGLKLAAPGSEYGWKAYLWDITDWEEYNAKGGELGWFVDFSNREDVEYMEELFQYSCTVDAMDGSICGACTHQGFIDGETVWYEH